MKKQGITRLEEQLREAATEDESIKVQLMKQYLITLAQKGQEPTVEELAQMYELFKDGNDGEEKVAD